MKKYSIAAIFALTLVLLLAGCRRNGSTDETTAPATMPSETFPGDVTHAATNPPTEYTAAPTESSPETHPETVDPDNFVSSEPADGVIPRSRKVPIRR